MTAKEAAMPHRPLLGFSLIEMMVVVAIATILMAIAVPSYMTYVRQTRRTEARTAVLDLAGREERYFSTSGAAYTTTPANLGYTGLGSSNPIGSGYYYLTVCSPACAPSAVAAPSYSVTATAVAGTSQVADTQCGSFTVDSAGQQYASGTQTAAYCWSN
jgi:type IV pilus assembly protein PilE